MKKTNIFFLLTGVLLSLLFIGFASQIWELASGDMEFLDQLYISRADTVCGVLVVALSWGLAALYYFVIDSVRLSRWWHWLIVSLIGFVIDSMAVRCYLFTVFMDVPGNFVLPVNTLSLFAGVMGIVVFTIASYSMRWWSTNCRHTPLPE